MKRVLVLTTTYPTFLSGDGTPPFVHELTKRLGKEGLDMYVLTPRRPGTTGYEEQDGIKIWRYPYFFCSSREKLADGAILPNLKKNKWLIVQVPFLLMACYFFTLWLLYKYQIHIIHTHWIFMNGFIGALVKKIKKNITLICTSHGSDLHSLGGGMIDRIKKRTIKQCDEVTVVSNYLQGQLNQLMGGEYPAHIIPMGVDEKKFHPNKYDETIKQKYAITGKFLLFVGRLAPEKGISDLIDAMPAVITSFPDIKLLIIGSGPLEFELKKQVEDLCISYNIIFVGAIPNNELPKFFATADVFISLSKKESFGLVLVESLMCDTPVVATGGIGSDDIIIDGENGFLIFDPGQVGKAIQILLGDATNEYRKSVVDKFSWEVISEKYFKLMS